jgi:glutaredoxin
VLRLFAKPRNCQQCEAVKRWLRDPKRELVEGRDYEILDVTAPGFDLSPMTNLGFSQAPVTFIDGQEPFYGFDITKLAAWYATRA